MTEMLRYKWTSFGPMLDEDGPFVLFVDAKAGQRDAIAAVAQRVEALLSPWPNTWPGMIRRGDVITAIRGEQ